MSETARRDERLESAQQAMAAMGLGGFDKVIASVQALESSGDAAEAVSASRATFLALIETGRVLLTSERDRIAALHDRLAEADANRAAIAVLRGVFTDQLAGLDHLAVFISTGDVEQLTAAEALFERARAAAEPLQRK